LRSTSPIELSTFRRSPNTRRAQLRRNAKVDDDNLAPVV
jgi:hypothetical protein